MNDDLEFQISELEYVLEQRQKAHQTHMAVLQEELADIRSKLQVTKQTIPTRDRPLRDDTFVHQVEWRIANFQAIFASKQKNDPMKSDEFMVMGIPMRLEFFPKGRDSTNIDGFCALFLWCPKGVKLRYQLRVGNYRVAPDLDEYQSSMGHGHSNFCNAQSQWDRDADSLTVGVDILMLRKVTEVAENVLVINPGLDSIVEREALIVLNRSMDRVEWRIRNIRKLIGEDGVPPGTALCSPPFSAAGLRNILLEFYPSSVNNHSPGYCGLYINCAAGAELKLTFFIGSTKRGPIQTHFDGQNAKGLPKFCRIEDEVVEGQEDLIVGVTLENPQIARDAERNTLAIGEE